MELIQFFKIVCRSMALAALATLLALMSLEWIMPGSVLPFVNLIVFALPVALVCLLLLIGVQWQAGTKNWAHVVAALAMGVAILAFFASIVGYSSLSQLGLLGAACLCLLAWVYVQIDKEFHN
ncbi:MAG: hypothetical protein WCW31_01960 [Patescibacteria group bacterium]